MEALTSLVNYLTSIFNPTEVFSSLTSFLGSGYVVIAVVAFLAYGLVKKLVKLALFCGCVFLVWFVCTTGAADQLIDGLRGTFSGILG